MAEAASREEKKKHVKVKKGSKDALTPSVIHCFETSLGSHQPCSSPGCAGATELESLRGYPATATRKYLVTHQVGMVLMNNAFWTLNTLLREWNKSHRSPRPLQTGNILQCAASHNLSGSGLRLFPGRTMIGSGGSFAKNSRLENLRLVQFDRPTLASAEIIKLRRLVRLLPLAASRAWIVSPLRLSPFSRASETGTALPRECSTFSHKLMLKRPAMLTEDNKCCPCN